MRLLSSACGIVLGLWCRDVSAGDLQVPAPPARWTPHALSTDQYESSPVFSPDGRELMFFRAPGVRSIPAAHVALRKRAVE